jgi:hypothetical protein
MYLELILFLHLSAAIFLIWPLVAGAAVVEVTMVTAAGVGVEVEVVSLLLMFLLLREMY